MMRSVCSVHAKDIGERRVVDSCYEEDSECAACTENLGCVKNVKSKAKDKRLARPAYVKAPVSKTNPERIKLIFQGQRLRLEELERELEMRAELQKTNIEVAHELSNDLKELV